MKSKITINQPIKVYNYVQVYDTETNKRVSITGNGSNTSYSYNGFNIDRITITSVNENKEEIIKYVTRFYNLHDDRKLDGELTITENNTTHTTVKSYINYTDKENTVHDTVIDEVNKNDIINYKYIYTDIYSIILYTGTDSNGNHVYDISKYNIDGKITDRRIVYIPQDDHVNVDIIEYMEGLPYTDTGYNDTWFSFDYVEFFRDHNNLQLQVLFYKGEKDTMNLHTLCNYKNVPIEV